MLDRSNPDYAMLECEVQSAMVRINHRMVKAYIGIAVKSRRQSEAASRRRGKDKGKSKKNTDAAVAALLRSERAARSHIDRSIKIVSREIKSDGGIAALLDEYARYLSDIMNGISEFEMSVNDAARGALKDAQQMKSILHIGRAYPADAMRRARKLGT